MNTQISFTANEDLKKEAMRKAKERGITLKSVLVLSMEAFVQGKINFGVTSQNEKEIEEISFDNPSLNAKASKLANLLK